MIRSSRMGWVGYLAQIGREKRLVQSFRYEKLKEGGHWKDIGIDWFHLAQDRLQWQAAVNTVMKFRVPKSAGYVLTVRSVVELVGKCIEEVV
jgi:hypothetical protein